MSESEAKTLGITDADRRKMGEIAASNKKRSNPNAGNYPADHPIVQWARVEVACLAVIEDVEYTKAKWLAKGSEYSTREIGRALGRLREEGLVQIDGASCASRRYRITMEGSA